MTTAYGPAVHPSLTLGSSATHFLIAARKRGQEEQKLCSVSCDDVERQGQQVNHSRSFHSGGGPRGLHKEDIVGRFEKNCCLRPAGTQTGEER